MDGAAPEKSSPEKPLSGCSLAELEAQITELAGQLNAANYRWLTLIGEFDRRQGWADGSLHSCAHWLNFKVGLNMGAAREKVQCRERRFRGNVVLERKVLIGSCRPSPSAAIRTVLSRSASLRSESDRR